MKYFIITSFILLSGCAKTVEDISDEFLLPKELKDCRVYNLQASNLSTIKVVRCPQSTTTLNYLSGKNTQTSAIVE